MNETALGIEGMDVYMPMIQATGLVFNIIGVAAFLLTAWGLYNVNKKLGEEHPWLSFIPVVNYYMYFIAGENSFVKYFIYPLLGIFVGTILAAFTFGISLLVAVVVYLYLWIKNLNSISIRTRRGTWTTVGLLFVPYIMFPIVGYKLGAPDSNTLGKSENKDKKEEEEIIEL